jgi:glycosyltransferase involved in cell wall biosynthesis
LAEALTEDDIAQAESIGNVHFVGERADVDQCYAAFDLYALASYREGFPRSAMEAAAMGLPVVATDIRGCRQVVEDGRTGRLVPVRDADALAATIAAIAADPEARGAMAVAGRAKAVRDFDQRRCIDITLGTYEALWGRQPEGAAA